jgi:hypothetical protein
VRFLRATRPWALRGDKGNNQTAPQFLGALRHVKLWFMIF